MRDDEHLEPPVYVPRAYYFVIFTVAALLVYFTPRRPTDAATLQAARRSNEAQRIEQLESSGQVLWHEVERLTLKVESVERWPIPVEVTLKDLPPIMLVAPSPSPTVEEYTGTVTKPPVQRPREKRK